MFAGGVSLPGANGLFAAGGVLFAGGVSLPGANGLFAVGGVLVTGLAGMGLSLFKFASGSLSSTEGFGFFLDTVTLEGLLLMPAILLPANGFSGRVVCCASRGITGAGLGMGLRKATASFVFCSS